MLIKIPFLSLTLAMVICTIALSQEGPEPDARQRALAVRALGESDDDAAPALLVAALADPNVFVRNAAVQALHQRGTRDTDGTLKAALMAALADEHPEVRAGAAETLGMLRAQTAAEDLIRLLEDPWPGAQHHAACALARIGAITAAEALARLVQNADEAPFARMGAAWALGELSAPESVEPLLNVIREARRGEWNYTSVYVYAAEAVAKLGDASAVPALVEALAIEDRHLRAQLARTLERLTGKDLGEDPKKWNDYLRQSP